MISAEILDFHSHSELVADNFPFSPYFKAYSI